MKPAVPAERIRFTVAASSLGKLLLAASERGVCALALGDDEAQLLAGLRQDFPAAQLQHADAQASGQAGEQTGDVLAPMLAALVVGIDARAGSRQCPPLSLALPLDLRGSPFQLRVWQALQQIPRGSTTSYGELARRIGAPRAARAVGGACAANRIALLVPCHRAVRADSALASYRWGIERKHELLRRERDSAA